MILDRGTISILVAATLAMLTLLFVCHQALAHDIEQWIADKKLLDPVSKQFCCGPTDCRVLEDNEVKEVSGGFAVHMKTATATVDEVIPYDRAMPLAPDSRYHACLSWAYPNLPKIRCFITPPGSS